MEQWRRETREYTDRIASLQLLTRPLKTELSRFPGLLTFSPSAAGSVRHRTLILANQTLSSAVEILRSVQFLWENAHFLAAAHCIRLLLELWGQLAYAETKVVKKLAATDGAEIANERLTKLLLGTKSGPLLPAGITDKIPAINVMDFVRSGEEAAPGFEEMYALLCDVSHPSVMHFDFLSLTFDGSWANRVYAKEAHRILEEVTSAAEAAVGGIELQSRKVYQECVPDLIAEMEEHARASST